jgi:hypothetical protein
MANLTTDFREPHSRGLVPAIHARATTAGGADNRVDTRVEPAHDDLRLLVKIRKRVVTQFELSHCQPIAVPGAALRPRRIAPAPAGIDRIPATTASLSRQDSFPLASI